MARSGDHKRAIEEFKSGLAALAGDPFAEPAGPVMRFDPRKPLRFTAKPLPTGHGLVVSRSQENKPYYGTVTISAGDLGSDIGFVAFKIDGSFSSVANTPPFKLIWDTTKFANGMHKLEITVYDRQGKQINYASRSVRTLNANAPERDSADKNRLDAVRGALWSALALRPSRAVLNYAAAQSASALGDRASANRYIQQTAAIDPTYRDARSRLALLDDGFTDTAVWRGSSDRPFIALTFDDGPKPGMTEQLLATLTRERVRATFFVVGRDVTAHPDLAKKIVESGMQIENHSYTHPNLTLLNSSGVEAELLRTLASVRAATGKQMRYFRPPGGNVNEDVSRIAARLGLTPCMWTLNGEALENGSPNRLVEYIVSRATAGAIILLHNGRMTTVEALPKIIEGLRKRGFEFATVDDVMPQRAVRSMQGSGPRGTAN
jgi:peptidoglycan/xylan/chitin deacetylase (PgdA/CDA1 family)